MSTRTNSMARGGLLYSADVISRILRILHENGSQRKTNLAAKAGLNYGVLMKYVNFLKALKWVDLPLSSGAESISISIVGKQVLALLESNGKEFTHEASQPPAIVSSSYYPPANADAHDRDDHRYPSQHTYSSKSRKVLSARRKGQQKKNIMIVDDDEAILMTFESFLVPHGYSVKTFSDAVSALRHFTKNPTHYSLAVLDIRLPNMNGLQLYQSLKAISPSLQVIFVTSLDAAQELVTLIPGASQNHIMRKPINKEHFVRAVQSATS